jgi:hypothetical protein
MRTALDRSRPLGGARLVPHCVPELLAGVLIGLAVGAVGAPALASAGAYDAHSMIYTCCTKGGHAARIMDAAKHAGARRVRLDVELHGITAGDGRYAFSRFDHLRELARDRSLELVPTVGGTPERLRTCPDPRCPARDAYAYARVVEPLILRAPEIRYWELWNEPDQAWGYRGTPRDYGRMLLQFHRVVRRAGARVVFGGAVGNKPWVRAVFTEVPAARRSFEVANFHIRAWAAQARGIARRWDRFFRRLTGRALPLWVTESGYPSVDRFQFDPAYVGGLQAQARYLRVMLPLLRAGGVDRVFVTLRDMPAFGSASMFAWEGVVTGSLQPKPALEVVRRLNAR